MWILHLYWHELSLLLCLIWIICRCSEIGSIPDTLYLYSLFVGEFRKQVGYLGERAWICSDVTEKIPCAKNLHLDRWWSMIQYTVHHCIRVQLDCSQRMDEPWTVTVNGKIYSQAFCTSSHRLGPALVELFFQWFL